MSKCKICKNKNLKKIVEIGSQPLSGIFLKSKRYNLKKYPLNLYKCKKCDLVQLLKSPGKDKMFGDSYEYKTSLSLSMKNHIEKKASYLKEKKFINKYSKILDIGCNDGTFLNSFGYMKHLYGIDPSAKKFKDYYNKNINLIFDFFSKSKIEHTIKQKIKFDVITSYAMFYDVQDPNKFCKDIDSLLSKNGIWNLELSYLPLMLKNLTYDQICHEHVAYYSLHVFKKLIEKHNLRIIDLKLNEINGGSIEIFCAKKNSKFKSKKRKIIKVLSDEKKISLKSFKNFNSRINNIKRIVQLFIKLNSKKNIIGYGSSTKGNVVLNHCGINNTQIKFICDASKRKINKYTPGTNIKIISKNQMRKLKPDYLLVLIWSFRSEVIKQEKNFIMNGGKLVFHLPRFHIINKENYLSYLKKDFKELSYKY